MFFSRKFKLDFIIVGAQKAGTSALDFYLRKHPLIQMGAKKELHFFDEDEHFGKEKVDYTPINKFYKYRDSNKHYGECTPSYMYWHPSVKRIRAYNPKIKLIIILRNPIDRAFSHWNMEVLRNFEEKDFYNCIVNEEDRIKQEAPVKLQHKVYSYKTRGLYYAQLTEIFKFFSQEQVLVLKYEDFMAFQEENLHRVFSFLGVKPLDNFEAKEIHKLPYKKEIDAKSKNYLLDYYAKEITKVEKLLHWDCSDWKS